MFRNLFTRINPFKGDFYTLEAYSIAGPKPVNEDSVLTLHKKKSALLLVADGVGGHGHGDWASQFCLEQFRQAFEKIENLNDPATFLRENAWKVAEAVLRKGQQNPDFRNCGTTLTGFLVIEDAYYLINIGDSRSYVFNALKGLKRLTKDHSVVQEMLDAGTLTESEAASHPYRARMTSAIGQPLDMLKMDISGPLSLQPGDVLLAFSDGVHDYLPDDQLLAIMQLRPQKLTQTVVEKASAAGSQDNITAGMLILT